MTSCPVYIYLKYIGPCEISSPNSLRVIRLEGKSIFMLATSLGLLSILTALSSLSIQMKLSKFIRFSLFKEYYLPVISQALSNCLMVEAFV